VRKHSQPCVAWSVGNGADRSRSTPVSRRSLSSSVLCTRCDRHESRSSGFYRCILYWYTRCRSNAVRHALPSNAVSRTSPTITLCTYSSAHQLLQQLQWYGGYSSTAQQSPNSSEFCARCTWAYRQHYAVRFNRTRQHVDCFSNLAWLDCASYITVRRPIRLHTPPHCIASDRTLSRRGLQFQIKLRAI